VPITKQNLDAILSGVSSPHYSLHPPRVRMFITVSYVAGSYNRDRLLFLIEQLCQLTVRPTYYLQVDRQTVPVR